MDEETKSYNLTCFISPLINQEKLEKIIQNIKKWITDKGGSISDEVAASKSEKKRLAYPIQKHREAFYLALNFLLPTQLTNSLNQYLTLEKDIIRYSIFTKPKSKPTPEAIEYKTVKKIEPFFGKGISPPKKPAREEVAHGRREEEKVKIEDLDKKLEEILNE